MGACRDRSTGSPSLLLLSQRRDRPRLLPFSSVCVGLRRGSGSGVLLNFFFFFFCPRPLRPILSPKECVPAGQGTFQTCSFSAHRGACAPPFFQYASLSGGASRTVNLFGLALVWSIKWPFIMSAPLRPTQPFPRPVDIAFFEVGAGVFSPLVTLSSL